MDTHSGWDAETLPSALTAYADHLRADNAAPRTVTSRIGHIQHYHRATGQDPRDMTREDVRRWLGQPAWSRNTRHCYFGHVRSWCAWLLDSGRVDTDPMLGMRRPRPDKTTTRPVPQAVVDRLLASTTGRLHTYVVLEAFAGLRAHEVAKIRGEDVTVDGLTVRGKGGRVDVLPTHPMIWDEASTYPGRGWWFPSPSRYGHVCGNTVTTMMSRAFDRIGVRAHGHQLRAHYATTLLSNGTDVETLRLLLRHESLATTQKYLEMDDSRRRAAILTLGQAA